MLVRLLGILWIATLRDSIRFVWAAAAGVEGG